TTRPMGPTMRLIPSEKLERSATGRPRGRTPERYRTPPGVRRCAPRPTVRLDQARGRSVTGLRGRLLRGATSVLPNVPGPVRRSRVSRDGEAATRVRAGTEVRARSGGLPADAADQVWAAVERVYRTGSHPGIALCLRRDGEVVLDRAIGHAT